MNPFNVHPRRQGITYTEHMKFAMGIATRQLHSVIAFASHAVFPFIDIQRSLDLQAMSKYLQERNDWIESQKPVQRNVFPVTGLTKPPGPEKVPAHH